MRQTLARFAATVFLIAASAGFAADASSGTGAEPFKLWAGAEPVPKSADIPRLDGVTFSIIKKREPEVDGFDWLHGVALAWHKGALYASWGHNKGAENTSGEIAQGRRSTDGGKTWGPVFLIERGGQGEGVSHGVFFSHGGQLWAFHPCFTGKIQNVKTEAFVLDDASGKWNSRGIVVEGGFWPLQEPVRMADGNFIMAGACISSGIPAAVAISHGDDLTRWDLVTIPLPADAPKKWGESNVIVAGSEVLCITRNESKPVALAAVSKDHGRTWSPMRESNLPMANSKPCAGTLSTGQRYLICTTTADSRNRRSPLTIAVSRPGGREFVKILRIRDAVREGETDTRPSRLAYPCALERDGTLYIGYSAGKAGGNRNDAELAVIPLSRLAVKTDPAGGAPDISTVPKDLETPAMIVGAPAAGRRVKQTTPGWEGTAVHHALYLPANWKPGAKFPVIVEYAGNGGFRNKSGDTCDGTVEGCNLGYGLSGGSDYIWVCMPFVQVADGRKENARNWWGDPAETVRYCVATVRHVCREFGGDDRSLVLCGFSRGSIACNYIGLRDDSIAPLWRAFLCHSHYDGVRKWQYADSDRDSALARLRRLDGRPQFISMEGSTAETRRFLEGTGVRAPFTFADFRFRNHTDTWTLRDCELRRTARAWLRSLGLPAKP